MSRAFVDPPPYDDPPGFMFCGRCDAAYDPQHGHACEPAGFSGVFFASASVLIVALVLLAAGVISWWPS